MKKLCIVLLFIAVIIDAGEQASSPKRKLADPEENPVPTTTTKKFKPTETFPPSPLFLPSLIPPAISNPLLAQSSTPSLETLALQQKWATVLHRDQIMLNENMMDAHNSLKLHVSSYTDKVDTLLKTVGDITKKVDDTSKKVDDIISNTQTQTITLLQLIVALGEDYDRRQETAKKQEEEIKALAEKIKDLSKQVASMSADHGKIFKQDEWDL
ncbi:MAG: hypothetical protein ACHQVS_03320 [Candidatus Babeliales bacterium]